MPAKKQAGVADTAKSVKQPRGKKAPATVEKRPVGRPSEYKPEYCEQAKKLCLLGATDKELADFFGVVEATVNSWKTVHPGFLDSIKEGREQADAEIAQALFHRAKGYSHKAVKIFQNQGQIITEEYTEHYPPDTQAASLWLRNRQPAKWRDKQELVHENPDGSALSLTVSFVKP